MNDTLFAIFYYITVILTVQLIKMFNQNKRRSVKLTKLWCRLSAHYSFRHHNKTVLCMLVVACESLLLSFSCSYEPLHKWGVNTLTQEDNRTEGAVQFLKELLLCQGNNLQEYLLHNARHEFSIKANFAFEKKCRPRRLCANISYFEENCLSARVHLAKASMYVCLVI